jgi:hypothetical protein
MSRASQVVMDDNDKTRWTELRAHVAQSWAGVRGISRAVAPTDFDVAIAEVVEQVLGHTICLAPSALRVLVDLNALWLANLAAATASSVHDLNYSALAATCHGNAPDGSQVLHTNSDCPGPPPLCRAILSSRHLPREEFLVRMREGPGSELRTNWEARDDLLAVPEFRAALARYEGGTFDAKLRDVALAAFEAEWVDGQIDARQVQMAVRSTMPPQLAKHSISEGSKAVQRFNEGTSTGWPAKRRSTMYNLHGVSAAASMSCTKADVSGVVFPIDVVRGMLECATARPVSDQAAIYTAAVLEYLTSECVEIGGNIAAGWVSGPLEPQNQRGLHDAPRMTAAHVGQAVRRRVRRNQSGQGSVPIVRSVLHLQIRSDKDLDALMWKDIFVEGRQEMPGFNRATTPLPIGPWKLLD